MKWFLRGKTHAIVGYTNFITCILLRNKSSLIIKEVCESICNAYKVVGIALVIIIVDNKISKDLIDSFNREHI